MSETVSATLDRFRQLAVTAGLGVKNELHARAFGSSVVSAVRSGAELRLIWDGKEQYLSLEISHGPATGERAGWVELFGVTCKNSLVPEPIEVGSDIHEAMEYGIELMSGERKST